MSMVYIETILVGDNPYFITNKKVVLNKAVVIYNVNFSGIYVVKVVVFVCIEYWLSTHVSHINSLQANTD